MFFVVVVSPPSGKKQVGPDSEKLVYSRCDGTVLQILQKGECGGHQEMLWSLVAYLNKLSEENPSLPVEDDFGGTKQLSRAVFKSCKNLHLGYCLVNVIIAQQAGFVFLNMSDGHC